METTQKTETPCEMSKPRKEGGREQGAGSRAAPPQSAQGPHPAPGVHAPSRKTPALHEDPRIPPRTTIPHPCAGKEEQAEGTVGTTARQTGHPRRARGWDSFPRRVVAGFTIPLMRRAGGGGEGVACG